MAKYGLNDISELQFGKEKHFEFDTFKEMAAFRTSLYNWKMQHPQFSYTTKRVTIGNKFLLFVTKYDHAEQGRT